MTARRIAFIALGLGIGALAAVFFALQPGSRRGPSPDIPGLLWPEPLALTAFALEDQYGQRVDLERLKGKWTFLFFGYTSCPDICPTTLSVLAAVEKKLRATPADLNDAQFMFVFVDPKRDSLERLGQYVAYFNKDFLGVTRPPEKLNVLTRQLGIFYELGDPHNEGNYVVNHTGAILLADPESRVVALMGAPPDPSDITERFRRIRAFLKAHARKQALIEQGLGDADAG
ncbi:MAG: SCO family protein [Acidiferrobacterales bacterium]